MFGQPQQQMTSAQQYAASTYASPQQYAPPRQHYATPAPPFQQYSTQQAGPMQTIRQFGGSAPPQATLQQFTTQQVVPMASVHPLGGSPPPQASISQNASVPAGAQLVPPGQNGYGEMLQVTIFGTAIQGAFDEQPVRIDVEVPGKQKFTVEPTTMPSSTIAYVKPGDSLIFHALDGENLLGSTELISSDYYPHGFEGHVALCDGSLRVILVVLPHLGAFRQIGPIAVGTSQPQQADVPAPVVAGMGAIKMVSPEEFQRIQGSTGAAPVIEVWEGQAGLQQMLQQQQHATAPTPAYAQPQGGAALPQVRSTPLQNQRNYPYPQPIRR